MQNLVQDWRTQGEQAASYTREYEYSTEFSEQTLVTCQNFLNDTRTRLVCVSMSACACSHVLEAHIVHMHNE